MIGQYLSNKNENATVVKSEFFFETRPYLFVKVGANAHQTTSNFAIMRLGWTGTVQQHRPRPISRHQTESPHHVSLCQNSTKETHQLVTRN